MSIELIREYNDLGNSFFKKYTYCLFEIMSLKLNACIMHIG